MSFNQFVYNTMFNNQAPPELLASCVVHFRPTKKWKGEFGFDWIRVGEHKQKGDTKMFGDRHYAELVGKYQTATGQINNLPNEWTIYKDPVTDIDTACTFVQDVDLYEGLINMYFNHKFIIPWKKPDARKVQPTGWRGEVKKTEYTYHLPIMTIRKTQGQNPPVTLRVHVELEKNKKRKPREIKIIHQDNAGIENGAFTIDYSSVKPKTGEYDITVTCNSLFSRMQIIEAIAVYDNPDGDDIEQRCGMLRVVPNSIEKEANLLLVRIKMDLGNGKKTGQLLAGETDELDKLKKILGQAYVNPNVVVYPNEVEISSANLSTQSDASGEMHLTKTKYLYSNCDQAFENLDPQEYDTYRYWIKAYIIDEVCKIVTTTNDGNTIHTKTNSTVGETSNKDIVLFKNRDGSTLAHEFLHALRFSHSFTNVEGCPHDEKALYSYEAQKTENVMDYSENGFSLWYWQWVLLWETVDADIDHILYPCFYPTVDSP